MSNFSISDNILYGKPLASNDEIVKACEIANAKNFIESTEKEDSKEAK